MGLNNLEKKPRGIPRRTPYADAHRIVADLPVAELQDSPDDTVAIRVAKSVARQGIDGKIAYAVEAANRTEGKPREMDKPPDPDPYEGRTIEDTLQNVRVVYGLVDPPEVKTVDPVVNNENAGTGDAARTSPSDSPKDG